MSESYKDRMINEYRETKERYEKLHRMIVKYEAGRLAFVPDCSLELLKRQAKAMGEYLYILEVRAEIEEVTLVDESPTFSRALNYLTATGWLKTHDELLYQQWKWKESVERQEVEGVREDEVK